MPYFLLGALGLVIFLNRERIDETVTELPWYWTRFDQLFRQAQAKYGVEAKWLKAIALNESDLGRERSVSTGLENPADVEGSKSSDGLSWGLMQVTLTTGRDYDPSVTPQKLNDAAYSVDLAARLLRDLKDAFPLSDPRYLEWVVKSYNQGRGNTAKERAGKINGYAQEYWERFQRNLARINEKGA